MPLGHFVTELASGESYPGPPRLASATRIAALARVHQYFGHTARSPGDRASNRRIRLRPTYVASLRSLGTTSKAGRERFAVLDHLAPSAGGADGIG
jgi:hypothetical protein